MEDDEHFDIMDYIESVIDINDAVQEADESIEDDILHLEF